MVNDHDDQSHSKPLLLYDGDCPFCCRSAASLGNGLGKTISVLPVQSGAGIQYGFCADKRPGAVALVECNGEVFTAAAAIFRLMSISGGRPGGLLWLLYRKVRVFRLLAEWGYRLIARIRHFIPVPKSGR